MHDWPLVHRYDGLWRWKAVAQCTVWSFGIVVVPPSFDYDLGLAERVEDLTVQQFISHSPVEAFAVSVLPWRSWLDVCGLCPNRLDPISDGLGDELKAVVDLM